MKATADKSEPITQSSAKTSHAPRRTTTPSASFESRDWHPDELVDHRRAAIAHRELQELANGSSQVRHASQMQAASPPRYGIGVVDARAPGEALTSLQRKATIAAPSGARPLPASGEGRAIPEDVRAKMEGAFGTDFSGVRIHEGPRAASFGALAYTRGQDIHFAPGQYQPHTRRGQEILGHELTHVVQQAQGRVRATRQMKGTALNDDVGLEREADERGRQAARSSYQRGGHSLKPPSHGMTFADAPGFSGTLPAVAAVPAQHQAFANPATSSASSYAVSQREVIQRKGTVEANSLGGVAKLYIPEAATTKAAYYSHGVYAEMIDVIDGVTLGYLAPHQSTTSANPSAVELPPNRQAEEIQGKWHSYSLTKEGGANDDDTWIELADRSGRAIAWVQEATTTGAIVAALKKKGYTDILAVHCREVFDEDNIDWDPVTNREIVVQQQGWLIDRAAMEGWLDADLAALDDHSPVAKDAIFWDPNAKKNRKVLGPNEGGQVRICSYE